MADDDVFDWMDTPTSWQDLAKARIKADADKTVTKHRFPVLAPQSPFMPQPRPWPQKKAKQKAKAAGQGFVKPKPKEDLIDCILEYKETQVDDDPY